ncbi:MAG: glycosyltransferase family 10 domain-containing protein [Planctomycetales bacterium]|jgi:hypothetical protein
MPRVLLTTCCPDWPIARQTPGGRGVWEDFEFVVDQSDVTCDAWVAFDNPTSSVAATCVPDNMFFLSAEPPEVRSYGSDFLRQFRWVMTCHDVKHRGLIAAQQSHPWHVGVDCDNNFTANLNYDSLSKMSAPTKTHLISTVISNKALTPAHRQRLEFVRRLKQRLGDAFHVVGRGHQKIGDKWQAVAPYRFHLALENAQRPHYMTEKISDAFLGSSFPFYFGGAAAADHYPVGSFEPIDIFRADEAIEQICRGMDEQLDIVRRTQVAQARQAVLNELNIFPTLVRLLRDKMVDGPKQTLQLYPKNQHFKLAMASITRPFRRAA